MKSAVLFSLEIHSLLLCLGMASAQVEHSLLSDKAILKHIQRGTIVIEPFARECLSTSSYDVTLGPYFYRETNPEPGHGTL
jgi:hypothetical protein